MEEGFRGFPHTLSRVPPLTVLYQAFFPKGCNSSTDILQERHVGHARLGTRSIAAGLGLENQTPLHKIIQDQGVRRGGCSSCPALGS